MTEQQIEEKYNALMQDVATKHYYTRINLTNRVNCYVCPSPICNHITKTRDVDAGVTPMHHRCEKCGGWASSTGYRDFRPDQQPTQEWFRPTLEQVQQIAKENPYLLDHILSGGLDVRPINSTKS
jgi:hypothetical protein